MAGWSKPVQGSAEQVNLLCQGEVKISLCCALSARLPPLAKIMCL